MWLCVWHGCSCVQINDTSGWRVSRRGEWENPTKKAHFNGLLWNFLLSCARVAFKYAAASQEKRTIFLSTSTSTSKFIRIMHESRKMFSFFGNLFLSRFFGAITKAWTIRNLNLFIFKRRKLITKKKSWHRKKKYEKISLEGGERTCKYEFSFYFSVWVHREIIKSSSFTTATRFQNCFFENF